MLQINLKTEKRCTKLYINLYLNRVKVWDVTAKRTRET